MEKEKSNFHIIVKFLDLSYESAWSHEWPIGSLTLGYWKNIVILYLKYLPKYTLLGSCLLSRVDIFSMLHYVTCPFMLHKFGGLDIILAKNDGINDDHQSDVDDNVYNCFHSYHLWCHQVSERKINVGNRAKEKHIANIKTTKHCQ